ncbi:hypothetical protein Tco_0322163 [Tanacetum coccineum]
METRKRKASASLSKHDASSSSKSPPLDKVSKMSFIHGVDLVLTSFMMDAPKEKPIRRITVQVSIIVSSFHHDRTRESKTESRLSSFPRILIRINFMSLQETKMEDIDVCTIKEVWGNMYFDHVVGPLVGFSGGIMDGETVVFMGGFNVVRCNCEDSVSVFKPTSLWSCPLNHWDRWELEVRAIWFVFYQIFAALLLFAALFSPKADAATRRPRKDSSIKKNVFPGSTARKLLKDLQLHTTDADVLETFQTITRPRIVHFIGLDNYTTRYTCVVDSIWIRKKKLIRHLFQECGCSDIDITKKEGCLEKLDGTAKMRFRTLDGRNDAEVLAKGAMKFFGKSWDLE